MNVISDVSLVCTCTCTCIWNCYMKLDSIVVNYDYVYGTEYK